MFLILILDLHLAFNVKMLLITILRICGLCFVSGMILDFFKKSITTQLILHNNNSQKNLFWGLCCLLHNAVWKCSICPNAKMAILYCKLFVLFFLLLLKIRFFKILWIYPAQSSRSVWFGLIKLCYLAIKDGRLCGWSSKGILGHWHCLGSTCII